MLDSAKLIGFLFTTDYDKAKDFFVGKLGFRFVSLDQFGLVMRCGANMIRVSKIPNFTPAQGTVLGWEVSNIEETLTSLTQQGITAEQYPFMKDSAIWTAPSGDKVVWFKDPDGNILGVSQHVSTA